MSSHGIAGGHHGRFGFRQSSLAFDTLYAEGQRRLLASMSAYAKRFVNQLRKPDVDFVQGLSPVISIDQKTVGSNPRSTVGTMTDLWDYLRMLYATLGTPHCPRCEQPVATRSPQQMLEHLLGLPRGTEVEVRAPVFEIFGEDWEHVFEQVRLQGYRRVRIDGEAKDLGSHFEVGEDEHPFVEAILTGRVVGPELMSPLPPSNTAQSRHGSSSLLRGFWSSTEEVRKTAAGNITSFPPRCTTAILP